VQGYLIGKSPPAIEYVRVTRECGRTCPLADDRRLSYVSQPLATHLHAATPACRVPGNQVFTVICWQVPKVRFLFHFAVLDSSAVKD